MNAALADWPLRRWCAEAARQWGWRQTMLAIVLGQASQIWWGMPVSAFQPGPAPFLTTGIYHTLQTGFPLVFLVSVAERAVGAGAGELRAYGLAVAVTLGAGNSAGHTLAALLLGQPMGWIAAENLHFIAGNMLPLSLGVAVYAQWRREQRSRRRVHAHQLERTLAQQRLHAAHLLALQARVEPELLFDTLQRVETLMDEPGGAADALLADLIGMLRAMLPVAGASASTVAREFALIGAYGRVTGAAGLQPEQLSLQSSPSVARASLAPMVLLPVLRALSGTGVATWQVQAARAGDSLRLAVLPGAGEGRAIDAALQGLDAPALRAQLCAVHGATARCDVLAGARAGLIIEIPYRDDQSPDC
ncbi:MAG: histidine kinase [Pseudomonadota bacterium]